MSVGFDNGTRVIEKWDQVLSAVSAEPRRQLIVSLRDAEPGESVPLPGSAMNPAVPVDADRLRTTLRHMHLPILAESGFIEWDTDPLCASRGPRFDEVAVVFEALHTVAPRIPDSLVIGCHRLEAERQHSTDRY